MQRLISSFSKRGKAVDMVLDAIMSVLILLLTANISILIINLDLLASFVLLIIIYYATSYYFILSKNKVNATLRNYTVYFVPVLTLLIASSVVYGIVYHELSQLTDPYEKTNYIASLLTHNRWCYIDNSCLLKNIGQASDLFTWIVMGYSRCSGIAYIAMVLLNQYGVEAYYAGFPGEDHFFVVANISGKLYVIDPGLYNRAVTIEERIRDRLKNWGSISYIAVYRGDGVIDLTNKYPEILPYDTIVIKVLNNSKPVPNACIILKHRFQNYKETEIPGNGYCLYTNSSGEVVIHLGIPHYKEKAQYYEPFFHIYVDGKDTGITVSSNGTYTTQYIVVHYPSK